MTCSTPGRQLGREGFNAPPHGIGRVKSAESSNIECATMRPQLCFRPACQRDIDELGALKLRSSLAWGDYPEELQALPEAKLIPAAHLPFMIVAEITGEIVGFATVLPSNDGSQSELEDLFVDPAVWRRGVGTQLLYESERRAIALGAHSLRVVASERARPFYRACGYRVIGTVMTTFAPAPEMHKDLV